MCEGPGKSKIGKMEKSDETLFLQNECLKETILKFNVGGTRFETSAATLHKHDKSKLARFDDMHKYFRPQTGEYFLDREPEVFKAILNYYRFGELHVPLGICGQVFQRELEYWQIDENNIEQCCWASYHSYLEKKEALTKMEKALHATDDDLMKTDSSSKWGQFRNRGWIFLEDPYSSRIAMVYAWISMFFVLTSICALCLETVPSLRLNMTTADWAEFNAIPRDELWYIDYYLDSDYYYDNENSTSVSPEGITEGTVTLQKAGDTNDLSERTSEQMVITTTMTLAGNGGRPPPPVRKKRELKDKNNLRNPQNNTVANQRIKRDNHAPQSPFNNEEPPPDGEQESLHPKELGGTNSSNPHKDPVRKQKPLTTLAPESPRDLQRIHPVFYYIDCICTFYFVLDISTRFIFSPRKCKFLIHPLTIIDVLSIIGTGLNIVIPAFFPREKYRENAIDVVFAIFRCIRIFRVFRLIRHYTGLMILFYTLKASIKEIVLLLTFFGITMLFFGCLMYFADDPNRFTSIPLAFWFALVTMTTVGYGDMYPSTGMGYIIGSMCVMSGVLVIAFTVPVIVNNFMLYYGHAQSKPKAGRKRTVLSDVVAASTPALGNITTVVSPRGKTDDDNIKNGAKDVQRKNPLSHYDFPQGVTSTDMPTIKC